ncbi:glycosyltransferase family 39 protein [Candidatus Sumerlaeota bacterium]|nr:glycosyltransferase family 39 protein [Candidatus Sumerlaeota bacterium]
MMRMKGTYAYEHFFYFGLLLIVFIVFSPALGGYFHADDWFHLLTPVNAKWWQTFTGDWFTGEPHQDGLYRPLIRLSIVVDMALFGLHSSGFHLTNIIFHLLNIVLLLAIARLVFPDKTDNKFAYVVGFLFGLFPLHHQAVYWISGRTDVIATTFALAMLLCVIKFIRTRRLTYFALTVLFFICALLTKELAIALVPITVAGIFLLDSSNRETTECKKESSLLRIMVFIVLGIGVGYLIWRRAIIGPVPINRLLSAQLLKTTYFSFLAFLYIPWRSTEPVVTNLSLLMLLILPVLILIGSARRWWREHLFLFLWVIFSILPMVGFPVSCRDGQRLLYFPSAGWFLFWVFGLRHLLATAFFRRVERSLLTLYILALAILVGVFTYKTFRNSIQWRAYSSETQAIVKHSVDLLKRFQHEQAEFSVAVVSTLPPPRLSILSPLKAINAALRVMGDESWDVSIYFTPEMRPPESVALVIEKGHRLALYRLKDVVVRRWAGDKIISAWQCPAGTKIKTPEHYETQTGIADKLHTHMKSTLSRRKIPTEQTSKRINGEIEIVGKNLLLVSPELNLPEGWILVSLYFKIDTEKPGNVFWRCNGEGFSPQRHQLIFNDVGGHFARRNIPLNKVNKLKQLKIIFSHHGGSCQIRDIKLYTFLLDDTPVFTVEY